jgi:hypothetical protein
LHALCLYTRLDREHITGLVAIRARAVPRDRVVITGLVAIKARAVPRDRVVIRGLVAIRARAVPRGPVVIRDRVAIRARAAPRDRVVITGLVAIMDRAAIMDIGVIMGTVDTTGMEIRTAHVSGSAQDGDQGGGLPRPTLIIHITRITQSPLLLSRNSPRRMFNRISRNPIIGTTVRIPRATTPKLSHARADG